MRFAPIVLRRRLFVVVIAALALLPAVRQAEAQSPNPYDAWYVDGAGVSRSNCTYWAWQRWLEVYGVELPRWGNAGEWAGNAAAAGFVVSNVPVMGSIVVTWESPLGHVAFVEAIDPADPNRILISEYGYAAGVGLHERWLTTDGSLQFILLPTDVSSVSFHGDGTGGPSQPEIDDGTAGPPGKKGPPVQ